MHACDFAPTLPAVIDGSAAELGKVQKMYRMMYGQAAKLRASIRAG